MKPYVICHMNTSIDGRTWGSRWRPAENRMAGLFEAAVERKGSETVPLSALFIAFPQGLAIRGRRWRRACLVSPHRRRSATVVTEQDFADIAIRCAVSAMGAEGLFTVLSRFGFPPRQC
jgi:hypothetical protein